MTNVEKIVVIAICLIPIIAICLVLPKKFFKKNKKIKTKQTSETKTDSQVQTKVDETANKEEKKKSRILDRSYTTDEFKDYLKTSKDTRQIKPTYSSKREQIEKSHEEKLRKMMMEDQEFEKMRKQKKETEINKEEKTINEQIDELTPELKALLLTGILEKKDFDE